MVCWVTPDENTPVPFSLCSHSSGPKADSSPKGSRGLGGLKSEFLKQTAVRGLRTQDQPSGSKGRRVHCVCLCGQCVCKVISCVCPTDEGL